MKSPSGETLTSIDDILENWAKFYENLYHDNRDNSIVFTEPEDIVIPPILRSEIDNAISKLKNNKAPGPDAITAEMLKCGGSRLRDALLRIANLIIIMRQKCPEQLNQSEIIVLFKKGDRLNCSNYRPICLLSHVYKLVMMIIYTRISPELTLALPSNQAAYQSGRSTTEQIQTLQQVIEKLNEYNGKGVICFIDYTKAFDSIHQHMLWSALRKYTNIHPGYINILANLYEHSQTRIRSDVGISRLINILRGVKQGDLPSAVLFCIALMVIMSETFADVKCGIRLGGETITDKGYADDAGILTETIEEMNMILNKLQRNSEIYGLTINLAKTKVMLIGEHTTAGGTIPPVQISGKNIEVVTQFEYLGRVLSNKADDEAAVIMRIGRGWGAFNKVKSIVTSRHISMASKRKTIETYVMPAMLYATETITWKQKLQQKATVFQNHLMRWMCSKKLIDKIPIRELLRITKLVPIMSTIRARKLRWYGHIRRSDLPVRTSVEGNIQGKRKRGRPKRRWRDDIAEWTAKNINELNVLVREREKWRDFVKQCSTRL